MLIQDDLAQLQTRLREVVGAGEPLNPEVIEQVQQAWGLTMRDGFGQTETTLQIGNPPGQPRQARLDGPADAGLHGRALDPVTASPRTRARSACRWPTARSA